ncbi:hypothetical protein [Qipengyuania sp. ASV99]|uniref:hypothetical protein n=1 Tax=Qipengyuania sp. ASV99 TaxID=3399681 RepID=UPI003A4C6E74
MLPLLARLLLKKLQPKRTPLLLLIVPLLLAKAHAVPLLAKVHAVPLHAKALAVPLHAKAHAVPLLAKQPKLNASA